MDYTILAAQLAVSATAIAAVVFIPPPFGWIVSTAINLTANITISAITGNVDVLSLISSIAGAAFTGIKEFELLGKISSNIGNSISNSTKLALNKITMNFKRITDSINSKIANIAPDKLIAKAVQKWGGSISDTFIEDNKTIMQKSAELEQFGEVRTDKKIISTKFNSDATSWIQCAHFEETKFINRNNILGTLTIFYYQNNGSRLFERKNQELNGNNNLIAISIKNARYKNDYVSGICRAKSWGAYYMRQWMIGKPGRGEAGINTAFWFGDSWRVDKKLKNLVNQYKNLDKVALNYSSKIAEKFVGKTKIGTKLLKYKDVFTKTQSAYQNIKSGNVNFLKSHLKKFKKKMEKK